MASANVVENLLSPMVLAFAVGVLAKLIKSDLKLGDGLYQALTIYLLLAIGLKGGVALSETGMAKVAVPALVTLAIGVALPLLTYFLCRRVGKLDRPNSAALAAHYGSVSAVTFVAATTFATTIGLEPEGFMPALVALMEVPGIVVAMLMAHKGRAARDTLATAWELVKSKTILLLIAGMAMGAIGGTAGMEQVSPFFVAPFKGALTIFLLEMGLVAAERFGDIRQCGVFVILLGILMPLFAGTLGVWLGTLAGLGLGGAAVLGAMSASASYIAAPAVCRAVVPEAKPAIYLTAALGVTFPFNLIVGIPLFAELAKSIGR